MKPYIIRQSTPLDLPRIHELIAAARSIMRSDGNLHQWPEGYPQQQVIENDIRLGNSYMMLDEDGTAIATFAFIVGPDPTYGLIVGGQWIDDVQRYGTIHRLASLPLARGVAQQCFDWCYAQVHNLRADTHRDNRIMQHVLLKAGFRYCGIIYIANGDERLAYQKIEQPNPQEP